MGNGDLNGLAVSGLTAYPFVDDNEAYDQVFVASVGPEGPTSTGLALIDPQVGSGESPFITVFPFFLDGVPFTHDGGDLAVATCFP